MKALRAPIDDRGSLPMAMMVLTIGMVMSAMLLPLIVRQVTTTRNFVDRNTALNGAQIGMDVVMARVRAAGLVVDGKSKGLLEDLPKCAVSGDAGVAGTGEKLRYEVTIEYFDADGKPLTCPLTKVPTTASLTSTGSGVSNTTASRTLTGKYTFQTANNNIDGGAIKIASSAAGSLCMDAGSKTPAAGTALVMKLCNGSSTQQFAYTKDLYLKLVNSEAPANGNFGMCLHGGAVHQTNSAVVFQPCPDMERSTPYQWSLDGSSRFHSTDKNSGIENLCVTLKTASTVGTPVLLGSCTVNNALNIWRSDYGVGAGMAGDATHQLVNYAQFSRCLDVTDQDVNKKYMIAWFCKQSPKGAVDWNQIWEHPVPETGTQSKDGAIVVTRNNVKYCLKAPDNNAPGYVTAVQCPTNYTTPAALPSALKWTVFHNTGKYATSFRIQNGPVKTPLCLQPTDLNAAVKDTHSDGTSKVLVAACNSSELQKWNAPPNVDKLIPISDINEK